MTDAEINALAIEILTKVIADVTEIAPKACRVLQKATGEPFLEFVGESIEGFGTFRCHYDPLQAIKKLIAECETLYDDFEVIVTNTQTDQATTKRLKNIPSDDRNKIIGSMAFAGALQMVGNVFPALTHILQDGFHNAKIMAEGMLIMTVADSPDDIDEVLSHAKTDMTDAIERAAKEVADRRRSHLQDHLSAAPHVIAARNPGRQPKTIYELKHDAAKYLAIAQAAYREERLATGRKPTKVSIADKLNEGGIDPKRGSDTRLNAFNLKLARLGINYEKDIVDKVESELHRHSG